MMTQIDHRNKKILKGRVIIALYETLGRKPTPEEIEWYYCLAHIMHTTMMPYRMKHSPSAKAE